MVISKMETTTQHDTIERDVTAFSIAMATELRFYKRKQKPRGRQLFEFFEKLLPVEKYAESR